MPFPLLLAGRSQRLHIPSTHTHTPPPIAITLGFFPLEISPTRVRFRLHDLRLRVPHSSFPEGWLHSGHTPHHTPRPAATRPARPLCTAPDSRDRHPRQSHSQEAPDRKRPNCPARLSLPVAERTSRPPCTRTISPSRPWSESTLSRPLPIPHTHCRPRAPPPPLLNSLHQASSVLSATFLVPTRAYLLPLPVTR